jgi:hypothetical protein
MQKVPNTFPFFFDARPVAGADAVDFRDYEVVKCHGPLARFLRKIGVAERNREYLAKNVVIIQNPYELVPICL